jgi:catechol 2,3-dioxygenase-like lactoylglutathione lyase family enzyme
MAAEQLSKGPQELASSYGLGAVDQISFAVDDMEKALPAYTAMFGPFHVRKVTFSPEHVFYRGEPTSATLILGFARSGDIEIELVQVEDGDAPSLEHLRRHGPGVHHVRFPVEDLPAKKAELEAAGFETVLYGTVPDRGVIFTYLEAPEMFGHTLFELIHYSDQSGPSTTG